jgi:hypothetical protein
MLRGSTGIPNAVLQPFHVVMPLATLASGCVYSAFKAAEVLRSHFGCAPWLLTLRQFVAYPPKFHPKTGTRSQVY